MIAFKPDGDTGPAMGFGCWPWSGFTFSSLSADRRLRTLLNTEIVPLTSASERRDPNSKRKSFWADSLAANDAFPFSVIWTSKDFLWAGFPVKPTRPIASSRSIRIWMFCREVERALAICGTVIGPNRWIISSTAYSALGRSARCLSRIAKAMIWSKRSNNGFVRALLAGSGRTSGKGD